MQPEQGEQAPADTDGQAGSECLLCEAVPAILGLIAAAVIVFVSLDLLNGGRLTAAAMTVIGRGVPGDDAAN